MKESYNRDPLVAAAEDMMLTEDVAKIQKKVDQLKVGDKTNFGAVIAIGSDSITFKAKDTPKTKIAFRQRKMGSPEYLLMKLVKLTSDGKKLDKTFKESNEFVGAAAAAKLAGEEEFEFEGEKFPVTIGLAVAKKIMGEDNKVLESNEFVGAAAAAKLAGEEEFEFEGEKFPVTIGLAIAKKIMGESFPIKEASELKEATEFVKGDRVMDVRTKLKGTVLLKGNKDEVYVDLGAIKKAIPSKDLRLVESTELEEETGSLQNSLKVLSKAGIGKGIARPGRVTDMPKLAKAIHKNYKAITGEKYKDGDQVAMSGIIADLIGHFRIDGDKFITAWDKTIKEEKEVSEAKHEATEIEESNKDKYMWSDINNALMAAGLNPRVIMNVLSKLKGKALKEDTFVSTEQLDESEHGEWFTCEIHVKSSGQLYSTFYVQAKDMGQAKKKADNVFKELMKTTYPKDWPSYSKKFTVKVVKGDNIGELMP